MDFDIDDAQAQAFQEALIEQGLSHARASSINYQLPWTGRCHNCSDPLHSSASRFCDNDCFVDWEKHQRAARHRRV